MLPELTYSGHYYQLPKEFLREMTRVRAAKGWASIATVWLELGLLWLAMRYLLPVRFFWMCYVPAIFLIASRQGALLQLIHEAAHNLLLPSKRDNHWAAKWLCALPIGIFLEGYTSGHRRHHAYTNTAKDPRSDREKYRITDFGNPSLYLLFLKDLVGWTAISIFFAYKHSEESAAAGEGHQSRLKSLPQLCFIQAIVWGLIFQGNVTDYVLLWLVPAVSPHMFLMRIRGIAEHGLSIQLGKQIQVPSQGTYYTRSFLTPANRYSVRPLVWVEKILIGSFSVHYHHEHHLFPNVPYYHLATIHERISSAVHAENPEVYSAGYFAAAMRSLRKNGTNRILRPRPA